MNTSIFKKNKKLVAVAILLSSFYFLLSSFGDNHHPYYGPPSGKDWQQDPPIANNIMVRKLPEPLASGENIAMEISYNPGVITGGFVTLYPSSNQKLTFLDDGRNADEKAGDNIFSAYIKEDLDAFAAQMSDYDATLRSNNNTLDVFQGRLFSKVVRERPLFDKATFDRFSKIELSRDIFRLAPFEISVPASLLAMPVSSGTYSGGGIITASAFNPNKLFTPYRHAGYGPQPPPPPTIVKEKSLLIFDTLVTKNAARTFNPCNGTFGSGNPNGAWTFATLIKGITNEPLTGVTARTLTKNWLNNWMVDLTINSEFVKNRSSRMLSMVITRWIRKARHNNALVVNAANWQTEWDLTHQDSLLRYAPFSLKAIVNRLDLRGNFGYGGSTNNSGETRFIFSLVQNTITGLPVCRDSLGSGGLDGFNVIFEYGNVQTNRCAVKSFGEQWANLSTHNTATAIGLNNYLTELETITNTVTGLNANPSRTNNNKSAINQIRTNEIAISNATTTANDKSPRWQFREFKINSTTKQLEQVPLNNEPAAKFNGADGATLADATTLAGWVNLNANNIILQNTAGTVPLLLGVTPFKAGKTNYPSTSPLLAPGFWNGTVAAGPGFITNDSARLFFSQNTCTGCHSADTRTDFAMLDYKGHGQPGKQYSAMSAIVNILTSGANHKVDISPFLTGRDAQFTGSSFIFGDDSSSVAENLTDNTLTGIFYVKDAANRNYPGTGIVRKWGFNDLQRRSQDLTNLITSSCTPVISVDFASIAFFQPLNMVH